METEAITLIQKIITKENQLEHVAKNLAQSCNLMDFSATPYCYGYPDKCKTCEVPIYYNFKID